MRRTGRASPSPGMKSGALTDAADTVTAEFDALADVPEAVVGVSVSAKGAVSEIDVAASAKPWPAASCGCARPVWAREFRAVPVSTGVLLAPTVRRSGTVDSGALKSPEPAPLPPNPAHPAAKSAMGTTAEAATARTLRASEWKTWGRLMMPAISRVSADMGAPAGETRAGRIGCSDGAVERSRPDNRASYPEAPKMARGVWLQCFPSRLRSSVGRAAAF